MSSVAEPTPSPRPYDRRWAWGVRIASVVCISLPWAMYAVSVINPCGPSPDAWIVPAIPWTLFNSIMLYLVGFSGTPYKIGLTWAAKTGLFFSLVAILITIQKLSSREILEGISWALVGLGLVALMVSATKTYYSIETEPHVMKFLYEKLGWFLASFLLLSLVYLPVFAYGSQSVARHASTVRALRDINKAEGQYASEYAKSFSPSLKALGPSSGSAQPNASAASLIDSSLASGTKQGYAFNYSPSSLDSTGRIMSYAITARCWCLDEHLSFYTDESGVIRFTREDRPANAKDEPLPGGSQ